MGLDERRPVLVGVGTAEQGDAVALDEALDTVGLIVTAARRALVDAGGNGLAAGIGLVAATRGTTPLEDPGRRVARALAAPARTVLAVPGIPQTTLVRHALSEIRAGRFEAAVICGGEGRRRADRRRRAGLDAAETPAPGPPDEVWEPGAGAGGEMVSPVELGAGLVVPVHQYALLENARRSRLGWDLDRHLDDIADLWAGFAEVAATSGRAAFAPRTRDELRHGVAGDRLLAFPYRTWHASRWSVDQAAALVVCSVGFARRCGVPRDRWVFPEAVVDSSHAVATVRRRDLAAWPAARVLERAVSDHLGMPLAEAVGPVELYSCFPVAVRIQAAELGLVPLGDPVERPLTVTGGMTFAGGPFNNFVFQAVAAMAHRLREADGAGGPGEGTRGLVTGVSGFLHKPGVTVWSTSPSTASPLLADLAAEAAAVTPVAPLAPEPEGDSVRGRVVSYTVVPADGAHRVVTVLDTGEGRRVATVVDEDLAAEVMASEFVGAEVAVSNDGTLVA